MPPLHPLVIHFPIALYIAAVLFDGITTFTRKETLNQATRILMVLSLLGTGAAIVTGDWLKDARAAYLPHSLLKLHETLALCFGVWLFVQAVVRVRKRWRPSIQYMTFACLGVVLLAAVGHTGGSMAWPTSPKLARVPSTPHTAGSPTANLGTVKEKPRGPQRGSGSSTQSSKVAATQNTSRHTPNHVSQHLTQQSTATNSAANPPAAGNSAAKPSAAAKSVTAANQGSNTNQASSTNQQYGTNQVLLSDGATFFVQRCQACHSLWTTQKWFGKLSNEQWQRIVYTMQQYGANVDNQQAQAIIYYLDHQHS